MAVIPFKKPGAAVGAVMSELEKTENGQPSRNRRVQHTHGVSGAVMTLRSFHS